MVPIREHIGWIVLGAAGVAAAAAASSRISSPTSVDGALMWIAAAVAIAGWLARHSGYAMVGSLSLPLLVLGAVAGGPVNARLLLYGLAYALALGAACAASNRHGKLRMSDGVILLLLVAVPFRGINLDLQHLPPVAALIAGCVVFFLVQRSWSGFFIAAAISILVPMDPPRVSLFPWILAAFASPLPPLVRLGGVAIAALAAGRWAWPLLAVTLLQLAVDGWRSRASARQLSAPFYATPVSIGAVFRPVLFFPEAFAGRGLERTLALLVLAAAAFFRPAVAMLYGIGALAMASRSATVVRVPLTPAVLGVLTLLMLPWSGALPAVFPLPISLLALALVSAAALLATTEVAPALRILATGATLSLLLVGSRAEWGEWTPVPAVLEAGASVTMRPETRGRRVELAMSGGKMSGLQRGTPIGTVDLIDSRGNAYRRSLAVGDLSDWAAFSPGEYWRNANGLPSVPAGPIDGHGAAAYLIGSSRVSIGIPDPVSTVRVTAAADLPEGARLHIDALRVRERR